MQQLQPFEVRERVFALLTTLNSSADCLHSETVLFRQEKYCGHRFRLGEFRADWDLLENRIVVFNATGRPIRNLTVEQLFQTPAKLDERKAA